ncbi:MAG TPA: hydrogenase maturation protease [Tepidisphaeraceae bacterium]|jgi:hydrogenase maturation protease|nr:hydrogenase maturation protease [Tepidisphaeraceae bacterium]
MSTANILVAGIGNIFLGDDAFGSDVARRLMLRPQPPGVRVIDFGIRGLDLTYALADGCDLAILIDAMPRGGTPGTVYVLEPEMNDGGGHSNAPLLDAHSMDPMKVLRAVEQMGAKFGKILIVGCEPTPLADDADDMNMTMSASVAAAIEPAIDVVEALVKQHFEIGPSASFTTQPAQALPAPGPTELAL